MPNCPAERVADWPATDGVRADLDGDVLVCTIDRGSRGNALRQIDMLALADAFDRVSSEGGARAVLLRAEGRHFCTGADLTGSRDDGPRPATGHMRRHLAAGAHRLIRSVWECDVPVVAAVHGRADGLGCHLAAAAGVIVAARNATFSEPFAQRGFSADSGGTWLLPRRIGLTRATAMLLDAEPVAADFAHAWGLVTEVVDDGDLERTATARAQALAAGPTLALALTQQLVKQHSAGDVDLAAALDAEALAVELSIRSDDFKEGMRAFAERRSPRFIGR